jgi:hypothetical protein
MISVVFFCFHSSYSEEQGAGLYFQDISSKRFAQFLGHDPKDLMGMVACSNR